MKISSGNFLCVFVFNTHADGYLGEARDLLLRYTGGGDRDDTPENKREMVLRYISTLSPKTPTGQVTMGGAGGCLTGYLLTKIGKTAAFTVGTTILGIQLAHYYGYVKVDWKKIHKDLSHRGTEFVKRSKATDIDQKSITEFIQHNLPLSGGFAAGFLIGMALS